MDKLNALAHEIIKRYKSYTGSAAFTVGISGIDASGKGYVSRLVQTVLEARGYKVANINIDPWQNPIPIRLRNENSAENIYKQIFRWDEVWDELLFPLQQYRNIHLHTKLIRTDADIWFPHTYEYKDIDILLIDAILLFKKEYLERYHLKIWIDCSFETALQRAIKRNVERLEDERLLHDYHKFYYAAQRLHFKRDDPRGNADIIFDNDNIKIAESQRRI